MSDEDDPPESDLYCAHFVSVYDDEAPSAFSGVGTVKHPNCDVCGHPCADHPVLWGSWCLYDCDCPGYLSATAPAYHDLPRWRVVLGHLRIWEHSG